MISKNEHDSCLRVESLENRNLFAADFDDSMSEAQPLGQISDQPVAASAEISDAVDVDMFRVTLASGQSIDIDVDTPTNGPGGLGGYLRVFNDQGMQIASNNDAMSPDDGSLGFDPYIRLTAQLNGNYYIAISNWENTNFDPISGGGDVGGQQHATGSYLLTVKGIPQFDNDDAINEATNLGAASLAQRSVDGMIDNDVDVDMFRIDLTTGQDVQFDIDTPQNGPGGLGSYLTLFDGSGNVIASNNDGAAPGETLGFDAYLRLTAAVGGPYYLAVSNYGNTTFNPFTGNGDTGGSMYASGSYRLTFGEVGSTVMSAGEGEFGSDGTTNGNQAAPMIGSMQEPLAASSPLARQDKLVPSSNDLQLTQESNFGLGESIVNSLSPAFTSVVVTSPPTGGLALAGTSSVNFGPGQALADRSLDLQTAVATDLALMQSL